MARRKRHSVPAKKKVVCPPGIGRTARTKSPSVKCVTPASKSMNWRQRYRCPHLDLDVRGPCRRRPMGSPTPIGLQRSRALASVFSQLLDRELRRVPRRIGISHTPGDSRFEAPRKPVGSFPWARIQPHASIQRVERTAALVGQVVVARWRSPRGPAAGGGTTSRPRRARPGRARTTRGASGPSTSPHWTAVSASYPKRLAGPRAFAEREHAGRFEGAGAGGGGEVRAVVHPQVVAVDGGVREARGRRRRRR